MAQLPIRYPKLGARFSKLMDDKGVSIAELAGISGPPEKGGKVTFATISRIRNGQSRPRPVLAKRLAELFGVSVDELLENEEDGGSSSPRFTTTLPSIELDQSTPLSETIKRIEECRRIIEAAKVAQKAADTAQTELERLSLELVELVHSKS
jgi:transcriptional regulator with XRE-family HTH domain